MDKTNTPLNEILKIQLLQSADGNLDISYQKGVILRQSIDLSIYDTDIQRIAKIENDLWLWAKKDLNLTNATVIDVSPPRTLDFHDEEYIYRRNIEIICKYAMTWEEIATSMEDVEFTLDSASSKASASPRTSTT